jgi:hypothetical protein
MKRPRSRSSAATRLRRGWDAKAERFLNDDRANALLQPRAFRGDWKLPAG